MFNRWKEKYRQEGRRQQLEHLRVRVEELHGEYFHMGETAAADMAEELIEYLQEDFDDDCCVKL